MIDCGHWLRLTLKPIMRCQVNKVVNRDEKINLNQLYKQVLGTTLTKIMR